MTTMVTTIDNMTKRRNWRFFKEIPWSCYLKRTIKCCRWVNCLYFTISSRRSVGIKLALITQTYYTNLTEADHVTKTSSNHPTAHYCPPCADDEPSGADSGWAKAAHRLGIGVQSCAGVKRRIALSHLPPANHSSRQVSNLQPAWQRCLGRTGGFSFTAGWVHPPQGLRGYQSWGIKDLCCMITI